MYILIGLNGPLICIYYFFLVSSCFFGNYVQNLFSVFAGFEFRTPSGASRGRTHRIG